MKGAIIGFAFISDWISQKWKAILLGYSLGGLGVDGRRQKEKLSGVVTIRMPALSRLDAESREPKGSGCEELLAAVFQLSLRDCVLNPNWSPMLKHWAVVRCPFRIAEVRTRGAEKKG